MSATAPSSAEAAGALIPVERVAVLLDADPAALRRWLPPRAAASASAAEMPDGYTESEVEWLRAAKRLAGERVPARRIRSALEGLRARGEEPPPRMLARAGSELLAQDHDGAWNAETGQGWLWSAPATEGTKAAAASEAPTESESVAAAKEAATAEPGASPTPAAASAAQRLPAREAGATVVDLAAARRRRAQGARVAPGEEALERAAALHARANEEPEAGRAITLLREVLELAPDHVDAHLDLGALLHEGGAVEEAEHHYREAVRLAPSHPTAWFDLGVALEDSRDDAGAIAAYRRAQELDADDADVCFNLSRLLERNGDRAGALAQLARYRRLAREQEE